MNNLSMVGLVLEMVWMTPLTEVHPAWKDAASAPMTFGINLAFTAAHPIQIRPCEVEVADAYPALGISLQELVGPLEILEFGTEGEVRMVQNDEIRRHLPAAVTEVKMWDSLGEGPDSAVRFVLETGLILIVRHQYPPMTLGLEVISQPTN